MIRRLVPVVFVLGCQKDAQEQSLYENVGNAFEECNPGEIKYLAAKHNFMLAFEPCGSNHFVEQTWSPAGTHLYFQLPGSHHIMDALAANKQTITVPTPAPIAGAAWLDASRLALPVAGANEGEPPRVMVFDREALTLGEYPLPGLSEPRDLAGGAAPNELWFTAMVDGRRTIHRLDTTTRTVETPLAWAAEHGPIDTFTLSIPQGAVALGVGDTVTLYAFETGEVLGSWGRARRGVLHPAGRWLALEYIGDPVSAFNQHAWDELGEHARAREVARDEAFRERLPDWYPKEVAPPRLSIVDRTSGARWDFTGFQGDHFEWYVANDSYASLFLWGFEGKQLNKNVLLGGLGDRLRAIGEGEVMFGLAPWTDPATPPPIAPPPAP